MAYTTGAPSVDLGRAFPEMARYAQTTVRLHPRRGTPGVRDSHIGGPLWWPAAEPWPRCDQHQDVNGRPEEPNPMVAVAQLTAADFPEIDFPAGTDLVQVLWCPEWHDQPHPEGWGQLCKVVWWSAAEVTEVLADQPDPQEHWEYGWDMVPRACVVRPERVVEYPCAEELPEELGRRVQSWLRERDLDDDMSAIPGCKVGGSMDWSTTDRPQSLRCAACDAPLVLFLQFDTYEFGLGSYGPSKERHRFWPLEERHLEEGSPELCEAREPTGMTVGRASHAGLFVCSADPTHPPCFFTQ